MKIKVTKLMLHDEERFGDHTARYICVDHTNVNGKLQSVPPNVLAMWDDTDRGSVAVQYKDKKGETVIRRFQHYRWIEDCQQGFADPEKKKSK